MWILFAAKPPILLLCLSHSASSHMGDSFGKMQALYFDLHPCVNGFLDPCDQS